MGKDQGLAGKLNWKAGRGMLPRPKRFS